MSWQAHDLVTGGRKVWIADVGSSQDFEVITEFIAGSPEYILGVASECSGNWQSLLQNGRNFCVVGTLHSHSPWSATTAQMTIFAGTGEDIVMRLQRGLLVFERPSTRHTLTLPRGRVYPCVLTCWDDTRVYVKFRKLDTPSEPVEADLGVQLYKKRKFTDATIKCGSEESTRFPTNLLTGRRASWPGASGRASWEIAVHRSVLASASTVFDSMFSSSMQEGQEAVVDIKDVPPAAVELLIQCIYTHHVPISEHLVELYGLGNRYMVPWLVIEAGRLIVQSLDKGNARQCLQVVRRHAASGNADAMELWKCLMDKVTADKQLMQTVLEELLDSAN